jgi:spermidine synthase
MATTILATYEELGTQFVLRQVGERIDLLSNQVVLLSNVALGTEDAFGALAGRLRARTAGAPFRVLVGGLGFGQTALAALTALGPDDELCVAERYQCIMQAMQRAMPARQKALTDPRCTIRFGDVHDTIVACGPWDAVLLDVDNGPEWATARSNARLYTEAYLRALPLREGGFVAVWSGYAKDTFVGVLARAGLQAEVVPLIEGGQVRARAYVGHKKPAA